MTEVSTEHTYTTNAPKGAERFDTDYPGWADRIDRAAFNITSYRYCAVAQVAGKGWYWDGLRELFPAVRDDDALHELARKYGFHIDVDPDDAINPGSRRDEFTAMWGALQTDWEHLIDARRTAAD